MTSFLRKMMETWPTILHGRVCYILEADSKRPIIKKMAAQL